MRLQLQDVSQDNFRKKTQRAEKVYKFIEQVGLDKIKYIKSYSATSISELTNEQIQEVIDYGISLEKLSLVMNHVTEISETLCSGKKLPIPEENSSSTPQIALAKVGTHIDYDDVYFDNGFELVKETNNDIDSNRDIDSGDEISDNSDDKYNRYSGYNEYDERDSGYYYHGRRYERKTSPMISPIISLVTT